jgi:hypothetical protein
MDWNKTKRFANYLWKNEKLIKEKNKVIKTREDLKRSKLKNKSNIDYEICDKSIDKISINEESIDGKSDDKYYDMNEDFSDCDSNYSSISDQKIREKVLINTYSNRR